MFPSVFDAKNLLSDLDVFLIALNYARNSKCQTAQKAPVQLNARKIGQNRVIGTHLCMPASAPRGTRTRYSLGEPPRRSTNSVVPLSDMCCLHCGECQVIWHACVTRTMGADLGNMRGISDRLFAYKRRLSATEVHYSRCLELERFIVVNPIFVKNSCFESATWPRKCSDFRWRHLSFTYNLLAAWDFVSNFACLGARLLGTLAGRNVLLTF